MFRVYKTDLTLNIYKQKRNTNFHYKSTSLQKNCIYIHFTIIKNSFAKFTIQ